MNKLNYVKPVTDVQVQVYLETSFLAGSIDPETKHGTNTLKDGLPTFGGAVENPSLIRGLDVTSNSQLWDDEE
jgi:hypothetical protein